MSGKDANLKSYLHNCNFQEKKNPCDYFYNCNVPPREETCYGQNCKKILKAAPLLPAGLNPLVTVNRDCETEQNHPFFKWKRSINPILQIPTAKLQQDPDCFISAHPLSGLIL